MSVALCMNQSAFQFSRMSPPRKFMDLNPDFIRLAFSESLFGFIIWIIWIIIILLLHLNYFNTLLLEYFNYLLSDATCRHREADAKYISSSEEKKGRREIARKLFYISKPKLYTWSWRNRKERIPETLHLKGDIRSAESQLTHLRDASSKVACIKNPERVNYFEIL